MAHLNQAAYGRKRFGRAGMTLVEVVFALGIISFCLLPLLALLSVGCVGYKAAIEQSVQADMVQQVRVLAANLSSSGGQIPTTYYRADGTLATSPTDPTIIYKVAVLPAANPASGTPAPSALLVNQVQIYYAPSGNSVKLLATEVIHVTPRVAQL